MSWRRSPLLQLTLPFLIFGGSRKIFCDLGFHMPLSFSESDEGPSGGVQVGV